MKDGFNEEDVVIDVILTHAKVNHVVIPDEINILQLYNKIEEVELNHY